MWIDATVNETRKRGQAWLRRQRSAPEAGSSFYATTGIAPSTDEPSGTLKTMMRACFFLVNSLVGPDPQCIEIARVALNRPPPRASLTVATPAATPGAVEDACCL
ncbi:MAG: hypothetical protein AB1941_01990 [Gemmatimonadota bacterium]